MTGNRIWGLTALLLGALPGMAQEKVMNMLKTDGTTVQTRVNDLKQITFLGSDLSGQGLMVKTLGGETATVLFETDPVVTVGEGKLIVRPKTAETLEMEIADIAEILFGQTPGGAGISAPEGFSCIVRDGAMLLRGIPAGTAPLLCTIDGRTLPSPTVQDGQLLLSRATLGRGTFVIRVGSFAAKIQF